MSESFTINADAMKSIVAKAIMEGITQDQRDVLIEQAITHLIKPGPTSYGRTEPSPLQHAFNEAIERACNRVVDEIITERPEFNAKVRDAVTAAMTALVDGGNYDLSQKVGNAVGNAVAAWAQGQR